jgi:hypothetical protein
MEIKDRSEQVFEKVWQNFSLDKARLRSLNEKDKGELKALMKTIFMSSLAAGAAVEEATNAAKEFTFNVSGANKEEVEQTVRGVVREELSGLVDILAELKNRTEQVVHVHGGGAGGGPTQLEEDVAIALHSALFSTDVKTNIDDVSVEGKEVGGVKGSLDALRKLRGGEKDK